MPADWSIRSTAMMKPTIRFGLPNTHSGNPNRRFGKSNNRFGTAASLFDFNRNACSSSSQNPVRHQPKSLFGIAETRTAGGSQVKLQSGQLTPSNWGLQGISDVGGLASVVFALEGGYDLNNGQNAGALFGRKAYVGLSDPQYGTLTFGLQPDIMQDLVVPVQGNNFLEYFTAPGDVDMADGSIHIHNAIKWASPVWSGVQIEAMYSMGGVAGSVMSGSTYSGAVNYSSGPIALCQLFPRGQRKCGAFSTGHNK